MEYIVFHLRHAGDSSSAPKQNLQVSLSSKYQSFLYIFRFESVRSACLVLNWDYSVSSDTQETDVYWSSSDVSVVSVSTTGQITALKPGTAVVTVTSSIDTSKKASVTVFVLDGSLNVNDDPVDQSVADTRG